MTWWQRLRRRGELERELDAELRFHFDRLVDEKVRAGLPEEEARRRARLEFGGVEQLKEECRDARATRWAHDVVHDLRFALRLLAKDRRFTATAVLALTLGVGVNSMFFTIVNAFCFRGPLPDAAGLVYIRTHDATGMPAGLSPDHYDAVRSSSAVLTGVAAYQSVPAALRDDERAAERVTVAYVSANLLQIVGQTPLVGRGFDAVDDRAGVPPVALLSADLWKARYAAHPGIVGRTIRLNGRHAAVIGVMREGFRFPDDASVWLPLAFSPELAQPRGSARTLGVFGRLGPTGTIAAVEAEVGDLARRLTQERPQANEGIRITAMPFNERFTSSVTHPAWLAFVVAGTLVLLVACANVANLLLARALRRSGEMAIRTSLGASRARVMRQLLVECGVLAVLGGGAGLLASVAGGRAVQAAIPEGVLPSWITLTMDGRLLALLVLACAVSVFLFGFVPALQTSRASVTLLRRDQRQIEAVGTRRWATGFLALQFALTSVLLAGPLAEILRSGEEPDLVIDASNVLTARLALPPEQYGDPEKRARVYERLRAEAAAVAGVSSAEVATALPLGGAPHYRVAIEGRGTDGIDAAATVGANDIGHRYFETFRVGVVQGRDFTTDDGGDGRDALIINQQFARLYFPNQEPIAKRVQLVPAAGNAGTPLWLTVVGIAPDIPRGGPSTAPLAYRPFRLANPFSATLVVRGADGPPSAAALRERLRLLDADLALYDVKTMTRVIADAGWNPRVSSALINTISSIALALAVLGLYAVTAHGVTARAREIGVRMALGAQPRHVSWLVLRRALLPLGIGVAAGAALTMLWNRVFVPASSDDGNIRLIQMGAVAVVIVGVGIAACLLPARTAVRLDPLTALRHD